MTAIVIDVSAVLGQLLAEAEADYAERVLGEVAVNGAVVPPLFWYEVRNVLVVAERRGRLRADQSDLFLGALGDLPIEAEGVPSDERATGIARAHGLTIYDAACLELAQRRSLPLATLDAGMVRAAESLGLQRVR